MFFFLLGDAPHCCDECGSRFWKLKGLKDHKSNGCLNHKNSMEKSIDCGELTPVVRNILITIIDITEV